jgi:hypothetical protein
MAAACASLGTSAFSQQPFTPKRVGIAPVGLGSIAEVFMRAVSKCADIHLTGFVTGHPEEKGKKFAAQYAVPASSIYTYDRFDTI